MNTKLVIALSVLVAALAGGGYVYSEIAAAERAAEAKKLAEEKAAALAKEVIAYRADLRAKLTAFDDAHKVAGVTSRIALGPILLRMHDASRAVAETKVPDCMAEAKDRAKTATERGIESVSRFALADKDTPPQHWYRIHQSYEASVGVALTALAKSCNT